MHRNKFAHTYRAFVGVPLAIFESLRDNIFIAALPPPSPVSAMVTRRSVPGAGSASIAPTTLKASTVSVVNGATTRIPSWLVNACSVPAARTEPNTGQRE